MKWINQKHNLSLLLDGEAPRRCVHNLCFFIMNNYFDPSAPKPNAYKPVDIKLVNIRNTSTWKRS